MDEKTQLFFSDPHAVVNCEWARKPAFFDNCLAHVLAIVDANPREGIPQTKTLILHAPTSCQRVQSFGLWAYIHRAIGKLDTADRAIEDGFFHSGECPQCVADLHRRRAVLRRNRRNFVGAIEDCSEAVQLYQKLGHAGHDLDGNGLASSYNVRAGIHCYMDDFNGAASDEREALAVLDPRVSPALYRIVITNLANALQHTGRRSDLLEANKYLKKARRLFKGVKKRSQERAKLDWITAQVRYQLGAARQANVLRKMMKQVLSDFLALGMALEAIAVASDLMKMKLARRRWGDESARDLVREILATLSDQLPRISAEVCAALRQVNKAVDVCGFNAKDMLKAAIDDLRETCGQAGIVCLVTWEPI